MTEDASPENLRKFLESDDPAMVMMGLSMAKGSGLPDDMLGEIFWIHMFHDDKVIRNAAKTTFVKLAPKCVKQVVKEKWPENLRKFLDIRGEEKTLAGTVIWYDFNTKERNLISKRLSLDPKEMITKHWMKQTALEIDKKHINHQVLKSKYDRYTTSTQRSNASHDNYLPGYLEHCKRKMTCRGCPKVIFKGDLRLSTYIPSYWGSITHYFCRKCSTDIIKPNIRYKLIEKWWEENGWVQISRAVKMKDADYLIKMLDDKKRKTYVWGNDSPIDYPEWLEFTQKEIRNEIIKALKKLGHEVE